MISQNRWFVILILLAVLFFVNIPPNIEQLTEKLMQKTESQNTTPINLSSYNQTINKTVIFINEQGQEIGRITQQYNETIIPEAPKQTTDIKTTVSNLGGRIWPSNPTVGFIILLLVAYFVVWPILKYIKELIGF